MKKGGSTRLVFPVQSQKPFFDRGRVSSQNLLEFWNFYIFIKNTTTTTSLFYKALSPFLLSLKKFQFGFSFWNFAGI